MNKLLLGLVALFMSANLYASNLIVNGGFEDPQLTTTNWMTFYGQNGPGVACPKDNAPLHCDDDVLVPGWSAWWTDTVLDGTILPGRIEIQSGDVGGVAPYAGNQKVELDTHHRVGEEGASNNIVLFQFAHVCPESPYTLNYAWKSRTTTPGDNDINVIVDDIISTGSSSQTHTLNNDWMLGAIPFVASEYYIPVAFFSTGADNTLGMFLDAISLTADNPEEGACSACILGKPRSLTMEYTGTAGSDNTQDDDYTAPDGVTDADFPNEVWIEVWNDNGNKRLILLASGPVTKGDTFFWDTATVLKNGKVKDGKVPPKTTFVIKDSEDGEMIQMVHFHTSCSQPLFVGDKFGALTVWTVN